MCRLFVSLRVIPMEWILWNPFHSMASFPDVGSTTMQMLSGLCPMCQRWKFAALPKTDRLSMYAPEQVRARQVPGCDREI
jgi:hypothetical protein